MAQRQPQLVGSPPGESADLFYSQSERDSTEIEDKDEE
jgi:hypothetical protein